MSRAYLKLLLAYGVSVVGDGVYKVVLMWWVYKSTGSVALLTAIAGSIALTNTALGLISGAIADLVERKRLMIAADVIRGILFILITIQFSAGRLTPYHVMAYSVVIAAVTSVYNPALMAWLPEIVGPDSLVKANSGLQVVQNTGWLIGPAVGGAIMSVGGAHLGFAFNGLSFWLSALIIASVVPVSAPMERPSHSLSKVVSRILPKARDGLVAAKADLMITYLLGMTSVLNLLTVPIMYLLPVVVQDTYRLGASYYGILESVLPIGVVLGSLIIPRLPPAKNQAMLAVAAIMVLGVSYMVFALSAIYWVGLVMLLVVGTQMAVASAVGRTIFQERVPADRRGTVFGLMNLLTSGLQPLGLAVMGIMTKALGVTWVLMGAACGLILVAGIALCLPAFRNYTAARANERAPV